MATVTRRQSGYGRLLVGVGLTVSLLSLLAFTVDVPETARVLSGVDPTILALAAAVSLFAQLCWSISTVAILRGVDGDLPRGRIQLGYMAGTFGKQVLPLGNVGGSAILSYVIADDLDRRFRDVFAAVTASELLVFAGSIGVGILGLVVILVSPYSGLPTWLVVGLCSCLVFVLVGGGAVLAYRRHVLTTLIEHAAAMVHGTVGRLSSRIHRSLSPDRVSSGTASFLDAFSTATGETRRLVIAATFAVVGWLAFSGALWLGFSAVGVSLPLGFVLFLTPASGVVTLLPTPGGLGSTEVGLTAVISVVTATAPEVAAAGVLVYRLVTYWLVIAAGGLASLYLSATVWHALD